MIKRIFKPKAVIIYSMIIAIVSVVNLQQDNYRTIGSDGLGYYAYLPAIFINGSLQDLEENIFYTNTVDGRVVNKYFIGTALLMSPFFSVGYAISQFTDYASDGYSKPFQFLIAIGALFYLWLGLSLINKLLKTYHTKPLHGSVGILAILFGTNLFYYGVVSVSMSHVYSFAMISGFLYNGTKFFMNNDSKYVFGMAIFMALIVLIRPINGIVFLIFPFLADDRNNLIKRLHDLSNQKLLVVIASLISFGIIGIQFWAWKIQSGSFIIWPYKGEGFYWLHPRIYSFLFSIKKGLFVYSPLLILSFIWILISWRKNRFIVIGFFIVTFVTIYVLSSWWNWQYGDGFGQRAMIDFYGLFAVSIALLLNELEKTFWIRITQIFIILCVTLNAIQSYQFYHHIIHPSAMTAEKYAYVFLKTGKSYANSLGGMMDLPPYSSNPRRLIYSSINDFEVSYPGWSGGEIGDFSKLCNPGLIQNRSCYHHKDEYGIGLTLKNKNELAGSGKLYVEMSLKMLSFDEDGANDVLMVLSTNNSKNEITYYKSFKLEEVPTKQSCEWKLLHSSITLPMLQNKKEILTIYIWNREFQKFLVDNFKVSVYRYE